MIATRRRIASGLILALALLSALGWIWVSGPAPTQAGPALLPSRETPTPKPSHPGDGHADDSPVGWITLTAQPARTGLWAVVQWRDAAGGWHDVDGWKGSCDSGNQSWGVLPPELGRGPFRWILTDGAGGKILGESALFDLPAQPRETVAVQVFVTL
jgi:hypothetical protein